MRAAPRQVDRTGGSAQPRKAPSRSVWRRAMAFESDMAEIGIATRALRLRMSLPRNNVNPTSSSYIGVSCLQIGSDSL